MLKTLMAKIKAFMKEEKGDFGVKEIAITVAIIIIIGAIVMFITGGFSDTVVQDVWDMLIGYIQNEIV